MNEDVVEKLASLGRIVLVFDPVFDKVKDNVSAEDDVDWSRKCDRFASLVGVKCCSCAKGGG